MRRCAENEAVSMRRIEMSDRRVEVRGDEAAGMRRGAGEVK